MRLEGLSAWIALQMVPGIGSVTLRRLVRYFGSAERVWKAKPEEFSRVSQLSSKIREALARGPNEEAVRHTLNVIKKMGAWVITSMDTDYPTILKEITNPPSLLYGIGDPNCLRKKSVAIVGSRMASSYGLSVARELSSGLVLHGYTVVSGMAIGVDTASHEAAVRSGGSTVAVMGCGIDRPYPRQNIGLSRRIAEHGAVITEFPPGTPPEPQNFPIRNRIISGLSQGVVVVEASMKSGSLITASCALDQNRDLMAVPGSIYSYRSKGSHWLIKQGAQLVDSVSDIIDGLDTGIHKHPEMQPSVSQKEPQLSSEEQQIFEQLEPYPQHIDNIAYKCGCSIGKVSGLLVQMELKDLIQALPGQIYQLK
ncbi:MAG: DNA-protecting protein DprA [Nitrospiraceae bacterium]|nr:DNA-protecting protein DprA [Nitrospiraceae bacterium]